MSANDEILNEEFLKPLGLAADASRKVIKIGITQPSWSNVGAKLAQQLFMRRE